MATPTGKKHGFKYGTMLVHRGRADRRPRRVRVAVLGPNGGYFWLRVCERFWLDGLHLKRGSSFVWFEDLVTPARR